MSNAAADNVATREGNVRVVAIVAYGLMLLSVANGITAVAAVVLAYIKRSDARDSVYGDHFGNVIATFWIALVGVVLLSALTLWVVFGALGFRGDAADIVVLHPWMWVFLPFVGLAFAALAVYCLYRIARGLVRAIDGQAY